MLKRQISPTVLRKGLLKFLVSLLLMSSIYKLIACKKYIPAFAVSFLFICGLINEYSEYKQEKEILEDLSEQNNGFI